MQIPILNGIYTDGVSDFRTSYPRNMMPVPKQQGISEGYLRPADGIAQFGTGPGMDRGGINWKGVCYRVMDQYLVSVSSTGGVAILGSVGGSGQVTLDYSFDRLAIASNGALFYWDGTSLSSVTDPDLGTVVDFLWVDGYFMTTDGNSLVVTELTDPYAVNPLKYGSSEADPDPIKGLIKLRNEVYALNRHTIEVFQNVGGDLFPFQRIEGAQMQRGAIGTYAAAIFMENIAFLGGGRNEAPAVWFGSNSSTAKLSTREIDQILTLYTESQLSKVVLEVRVSNNHQLLYMHLPDQTWVYDGASSQIVGEPVWFELTSSIVGPGKYRARNFVWCYDKWLCGDPTSAKHGYLTDTVSSHYGDLNGWDFGTIIIYNEGRGALFHELELVCLTGRVAADAEPVIWTSYTIDGVTWSQERPRSAGDRGQRLKRLNWLQQGHMRHWRAQKFRGTSDAHISVARLEARIEALNV
jgi:hypothetical protein